MAYDPNPAATHTPSAGVAVPVNWLTLINTDFAAIGAAWTSFTPTWTATGSNPALGNGTIQGAYVQLGKTLRVRYRIVMGTTTTYGTGSWKLRLPNSLSAVAGTTQVITAFAYDSGTAYYRGMAVIGTDPVADFDDFVLVLADGGNLVSPTSPITWGTGDVLVVEGVLEVA